VLGLLALPSAAFATRYVTTTGSAANDCSAPDLTHACDLPTAIHGVPTNMPSDGDEVVIEPGIYSISAQLTEGAANLFVHGVTNQQRPEIDLTVVDPMNPGQLQIFSGVVSYLDIQAPGATGVNMSGGILERVFMRGSSTTGIPSCQCYGGIQRDSVFVTTSPSPAIGVNSNGGSGTDEIRNVTAYSTDSSGPAIRLIQSTSGTFDYQLYNVIARNGAGGTDVAAVGPGNSLTFHRSNYGTTSASGGSTIQDAPGDPHQTAAPMFTSAAAFDFSEQPTSQTIDAGLNDPLNGPVDFAGNPRTMGASTDIGAYEFVPPSPPAPTPSTNPPVTPPVTNPCTRSARFAAEAKKKKKKHRGCGVKKKKHKKHK
jgi:hypothetical protein